MYYIPQRTGDVLLFIALTYTAEIRRGKKIYCKVGVQIGHTSECG